MAQPYVGLTAAWYTLRNKLFATVGQTPAVEVSELLPTDDPSIFKIQITVKSCIKQAEAIRLIIPESYLFGNIKVVTEVYLCKTLVPMPNLAITTPGEVALLLNTALWCNPLFKGSINVAGLLPPPEQGVVGSVVGVVIPTVIQFFNDDLSNLCNNYIEVASKVFQEVLTLSYGNIPIIISITTYDEACMKNLTLLPACCRR